MLFIDVFKQKTLCFNQMYQKGHKIKKIARFATIVNCAY